MAASSNENASWLLNEQQKNYQQFIPLFIGFFSYWIMSACINSRDQIFL